MGKLINFSIIVKNIREVTLKMLLAWSYRVELEVYVLV